MKIQLSSDIHTEFYRTDKSIPIDQTDADVLVLAGDIAAGRRNLLDVFKHVAPRYKDVVYVLGNHEPYGSTIDSFNDKAFLDKIPKNVHFLNPDHVIIDGVLFIGGCLYTDFRLDTIAKITAKRYIADFSRVADQTVDRCQLLYDQHYRYINSGLRNFSGPVVVVTHFLPSPACIAPRFQGPDLLNSYFAPDAEAIIQIHQPNYWLFGHTHDSIYKEIGITKCISNPYGYRPDEINREYDSKFTIEVYKDL